ncbi:hypothetical protein [Achromobacter xylosoxidans]|uniref:hypothetical protein n=1 Tax=Alcaligenes xylosoxydans xylosoxydans TaxID=85698 RepID=UPI001F1461D8|nr:hypothetical protein [Achromobacter xylosoxidans]
MYTSATPNDAVAAINAVRDIPMPDNDTEGYALNHEDVLRALSRSDEELVRRARDAVRSYLIEDHMKVNQLGLTALSRRFKVNLNESQYDRNALDGRIEVNKQTGTYIDLSDHPVQIN